MKNCRTGLLRIVQTEKAHVRRTDILSGGKSMGTRARPAEGGNTLAEMREFAGFSASTQRYIRRSLDISLHRRDALAFWSRDGVEAASIRTQTRMRSEEHTSELQSLMRISYAVFCLK